MSRRVRWLAATVGAFLAMTLLPVGPAAAHGGTDVDLTSNYRTRILDVSDVTGLTVTTVGLDGGIRVSWTGTGTLIVAGYQGEPYLRFDSDGVAANQLSPATWINQDRYGTATIPDNVDADAEPQWATIATNPDYKWHDHRTHWMSTIPPPQVQVDPERTYVIYERWEIPLQVDGAAGFIAGNLTWAPNPALLPWIAVIAAITTIATMALLSRHWRTIAAALAAVGTIALAVDTAGYVAVINDNVGNRAWAFVWTAITLIATIRLAIHAIRGSQNPTLAMLAVGLVLTVIAGIDRIDVLTAGFYLSSIPADLARTSTAVAVGIGLALTSRFLIFLGPHLRRSAPIIDEIRPTTLAELPTPPA